MGYNEMDMVWDKSKSTKTDKLVLLAIARRYSRAKGSWPSQKTIAKACGISQRSVRACLVRLEALGELTWVTGNDKSGKANLYTITLFDSAKTSSISAPETSAIDAKTSAISDKNFRLLNKELNKKLNSETESNFWPSEMDFRVVPFSFEMLVWARQHGMDELFPLLRLEELHRRFELHPQNRGKVGVERARLFYAWFVNDFAEFRASRTNGGM